MISKKIALFISFIIVIAFVTFISYVKKYQIVPDSGIHLISDVELPKKSDKVLVLSPHPDDETLGAGGFIEKAVEAESQIKVIIVSDGNKHNLKERRHNESLTALQILGLDENQVEFMDLPDGKLATFIDLSDRIHSVLGGFNPTIILTPQPADRHPDHSAVGRANKKMLQNHAEINAQIYGYLIHYPRYPRPMGEHPTFHMLPPAKLITSDTQWLKLDLTKNEQDKKRQAIKSYKSQLTLKNPSLKSLLFDFDRKNELFAQDN